MTVFLYTVGTFSGTIVGCIGTVLYCCLTGGLRGMPGWALGNLIIGFGLGAAMEYIHYVENKHVRFIVLSAVSLLSTAAGILLFKSFIEYVLYGQPVLVRIATNMAAFITDTLTIIISIPLAQFVKDHCSWE